MFNRFGFLFLLFVFCSVLSISGQVRSSAKTGAIGRPAMWEAVNIRQRNLLLGPGGKEMRPDLSRVTYIKEKKGGYSEKFEIKDGSGRTWVAKIGKEAQPETAAVRLLWALGYKTEINYLVPTLNVAGRGSFTNVRLEARPETIERDKNWGWKDNPFKGTREFQGLKMMMAFINNWDLKTTNNIILRQTADGQNYYVVSDLGATFGKLGSNGLPIFWRIGRSRNNPEHYSKTKFINGVDKNKLKIFYRGKNKGIFGDITVQQGRWLADLLLQLSDEQIAQAFRAANYSENHVRLLTQSVRKRINDLDRATSEAIAGK
jgi:hypothetical protein